MFLSDDVLTRLRKAVCWCNEFDGQCDTCVAATEINRLRNALRCMAHSYAEDFGLYRDEEHINEMCVNYYNEAMRYVSE